MANNFWVFAVLYFSALVYLLVFAGGFEANLIYVIIGSVLLTAVSMVLGFLLLMFIQWIFKKTTEPMVWMVMLLSAMVVFGSHTLVWEFAMPAI